jgi:hypothetical protein
MIPSMIRWRRPSSRKKKRRTTRGGKAKRNLATAAATAAAEDAPLKRGVPWRRLVGVAAADWRRCARRSSPVENVRRSSKGLKREEESERSGSARKTK